MAFKVTRADRASKSGLAVGTTVYYGKDFYGVASDDSRIEGIDYMAVSLDPSGEPFFTIPRADVETLSAERSA